MTKIIHFRLILILFFLSGFSGLIYESIWSRYLKLFLGHAAYAQALVLSIFMGGMALGAWYAGRQSHRFKNLFVVYALIEIIIGFLAIIFHFIFVQILDVSINDIIPLIDNINIARSYQWFIAAILITPQSFLLGTTFPLMANAVLGQQSENRGKSISLLYFSNSAGATIGVLTSGFLFLNIFGLPGTLQLAGVINILVGLLVYCISKTFISTSEQNPGELKIIPATPYLFIAFATGLASFIYEIVWIRMLSMVLGASTHSFELMLSAFILGLAIGGYIIRGKIDQLQKPNQFLGQIQIIMGLMAISSIIFYHFSFDLMGLLMAAIDKNESGYRLYSSLSYLIAIIIMLPTTIFAGMTLPLLTNILIKNHHGERSVSEVYAANTIGALVGILLSLFILLPSAGLKNSIIIAGSIDIALGFFILLFLVHRQNNKENIKLFALCSLVVALISWSGNLDTGRLVSGVYRTGQSDLSGINRILFYEDGKTASIAVTEFNNGVRMIATNGKSDASINMSENPVATADEITMVFAAALPMTKTDNLHKVANIGLGSGLTSHVLLHSEEIQYLDTIEIEKEMVAGAKFFLPNVENTYSDKRSSIHIEDAKTFFALNQSVYDLIISEPSNPWVSGTSSLFTLEFYHDIKKFLAEDGLFVQWLQTYEMDLELLMSVMKSLDSEFSAYQLYATNNSDILILASNRTLPISLSDNVFLNQKLRQELDRVGIRSKKDIQNRFLGDERILRTLINYSVTPHNSDYYPFLDLNAERARFLKLNSRSLTQHRIFPFPLISYLYPEIDKNNSVSSDNKYHTISKRAFLAEEIHHLFNNKKDILETDFKDSKADFLLLLLNQEKCTSSFTDESWSNAMSDLISRTSPYLSEEKTSGIAVGISHLCENILNEYQNNWLELYLAIGRKDLDAMANISHFLLSGISDKDKEPQQLLKILNFTAHVLKGNHKQAREKLVEKNATDWQKRYSFSILILKSLLEQQEKQLN